jgi:hypothetical protein
LLALLLRYSIALISIFACKGVVLLFQLIALFIGLVSMLFWFLVFGLIVLIIVRIFMVDKYSEESVVQRWNTILPSQASNAANFLDKVIEQIKEKGFSFESYRKEIIPTSLATAFGSDNKYEFLIIQLDKNVSCYVSAMPQGKDLSVTWLIQDHVIKGIYKLPFVGPMLLAVMKRFTFAMHNLVIAFAQSTKDAVVTVCEKIMDEQAMDKSHLIRRSSGKLGRL